MMRLKSSTLLRLITINALLFLSSIPLFSQNVKLIDWIESQNNMSLLFNIELEENGRILAGTFNGTLPYSEEVVSVGERDVFILKMDAALNIEWIKSLGGKFDEELNEVILVEDHIIVITQYREEASYDGLVFQDNQGVSTDLILKLNMNGEVQLSKQFSANGLQAIEDISWVEEKSAFVITGFFQDSIVLEDNPIYSNGFTDLLIATLDSSFRILNYNHFGQSGISMSKNVLYYENTFFLGGSYNDTLSADTFKITANTFDNDLFILKLDSLLQPLWLLKAGGVLEDEWTTMKMDDAGNIYVGGNIVGVIDIGDDFRLMSQNGNTDLFYFVLDSEGQPLEGAVFGGVIGDELSDLLIQENGDIWIAALFQSTLDELDIESGGGLASVIFSLKASDRSVDQVVNLPTSGAIFASHIQNTADGEIEVAGSFRGEVEIGGEEIASAGFGGFVMSIKEELVNTNAPSLSVAKLKIYPNPAIDQITIEKMDEENGLVIIDPTGRVINPSFQPNNQIELINYPVGCYEVVELNVKGKPVASGSFCIVRDKK